MKTFNIKTISKEIEPAIRQKIDSKTKPIGSLGLLERIASKVSLIQQSLSPVLTQPYILVFAGDHGITDEGVSAYPQEVTWQMVNNFVTGGAAINVFTKQHGINLNIIDAGVNHIFDKSAPIIDAKVAMGTRNFYKEPAMTSQQCDDALARGAKIVNRIFNTGCNIIGFGEMGIGNTSSAAVLMSLLCHIPIETCAGRGTGLNDEALDHKIAVLKESIIKNYNPAMTTHEVLAAFGGFEIVMMCGAMLQAAENGMVILVDGFISSAAFLCAYSMWPAALDYAIFCHLSDENAHGRLIQYFHAEPILKLNMRLGEGTGTAIAYPIIESAVRFLNEMASFGDAGVKEKIT